jgi:plastocyanin
MILQAALAVLAVAAPAPAQVSVVDNAFKPRLVTVRPGRAVRWRWMGARRHNVWFERGPRTCRTRRSGSCTRTFQKVGTYDYFCTLHGSMAGRVRVRRP